MAEYKNKADDITLIARKQIETSRNFRQPRIVEILENEDIYNYKPAPALQGRINVPFDGVIMAGFIDTLVAQVNLPPKIEFIDETGANLKGSRKITSAFEKDRDRMRLTLKDRAMKKLAALSGRAIAKYYAESDPEYTPHLDIVDYLDFHPEPNGGGHLDDHYFTWQENIFRPKEQIEDGAKSGWYDSEQVKKMINAHDSGDLKQTKDDFNNKNSRYISLGLDLESHNFVGGTLYNLVEGQTIYQGVRYHVIFDNVSGVWLRCVPLKEDFGCNKTPFISFASPQEDPFNFFNRGPADQIKPIAHAIFVNLNEILNNNRKRNWDMKAVDKQMFPDLRKLDWRQDGIVGANIVPGQSIQNGIYRFETPEISGALNLNAYLNNLAGEKLGVTAATQGDANEDKVGIYQGNQLQISKRMKLLSDSYEEMYQDLGYRYDWGLWDHAPEDFMVKLISTDGVGWEKITNEDKDPNYIVSVVSSSVDLAETDQQKRNKIETIMSIEKDPEQKALVNLSAHVEEKYRLAGYSDEQIKKFMNNDADATDELLSEARKSIELILKGQNPKPNHGATPAYLEYIHTWILDHQDDLKPEIKDKLNAYFEQHVPIAIKNKEREQFNKSLLNPEGTMPQAGPNPEGLNPVSPISSGEMPGEMPTNSIPQVS